MYFNATDRINKTLLNKVRKSFYKKDNIFYKFYLELENKNILHENDEGTKTRIPFYTPFVEKILMVCLHCTVSRRLLNLFMLILLIFVFFLNVEMFSSRVRGGKGYAAEQKIREFKKRLFKSKRVHKATWNISQRYGYAPDAIEEKVLESKRFQEIYDFYRLVKAKEHAERYERADIRFYIEN